MPKVKVKPYPRYLKDIMAEKSSILSKARALSEMGMSKTALSLWASAAEYEERIAPLLDSLGREREAALHRISAASCYDKTGDLSRAANLYRAALAGPLPPKQRGEIAQLLSACLVRLAGLSRKPPRSHRPPTVATEA
jgi:hypothetical protein